MKFDHLGECGAYLRGAVVIEIGLPAKAPYCQYCPLAKYEEAFRRYSCRAVRGDNWIFDPFHGRPEWCPLYLEGQESEG